MSARPRHRLRRQICARFSSEHLQRREPQHNKQLDTARLEFVCGAEGKISRLRPTVPAASHRKATEQGEIVIRRAPNQRTSAAPPTAATSRHTNMSAACVVESGEKCEKRWRREGEQRALDAVSEWWPRRRSGAHTLGRSPSRRPTREALPVTLPALSIVRASICLTTRDSPNFYPLPRLSAQRHGSSVSAYTSRRGRPHAGPSSAGRSSGRPAEGCAY